MQRDQAIRHIINTVLGDHFQHSGATRVALCVGIQRQLDAAGWLRESNADGTETPDVPPTPAKTDALDEAVRDVIIQGLSELPPFAVAESTPPEIVVALQLMVRMAQRLPKR